MPLSVYLVDLTYTQQTVAADVMPAGVGCLATYAEAHGAATDRIRLFKYPEKLIEALEVDSFPNVIGFSNYIWNGTLAYEFAKTIKRQNPETIIVFGGPNYPLEPAPQIAWLKEHPAVDFYVAKEGELAFLRLLHALAQGDVDAVKRQSIPSVHAIASDGQAFISPLGERVAELDEIPSPYSTGRLDEFFDGTLLPIVQTNRGCPFTCTFCIEGDSFFSKVYRNSADKIGEELSYIGRKMQDVRSRGGRNDLFIADSNFGMYVNDLDTCRALAQTRLDFGWPEYINVATGKNQKERVLEASKIIDGALRLSGSVQSLTPEVLDNIKRKNISPDDIMDLALKASETGANTYSEIIMALPGETRATHLETIRTVMDAGFTNLYLFQLMMLPGTELSAPHTRERFSMQGRFRVLPRCYGHFKLGGDEVLAAEIEEICVETSTFSFDDYVVCRRFHLLVTLFYNDGVFGTLLKLLRLLKLSVFRWVECIAETKMSPRLQGLIDAFDQATQDELWTSREDLEAFTKAPGSVERYIAGELGNNLLYVHKTLAITQYVDELVLLSRDSMRKVLSEGGLDTPSHLAFVDDALTYHRSRLFDLFSDLDRKVEVMQEFDIAAFESDPQAADIDSYRLETPTMYVFQLADEQKELIRRNLGIYGSTPVGIGRILSKVYVKRILRHSKPQAGKACTLPSL
ncbi:MAG: radical SAM protein [Alphaproteobacteria bacterium]|nr:radical SAM protein [Alphaproteobacteria bacterium]